MDGPDLAALVETGELLYATKVFLVSVHGLWIYDYLLTLGDEINFAWPGRKSYVFALFIANRYSPMLQLIWVHITMFGNAKSLCVSILFAATKWMPIFQASAVAVLAQITVLLRIYAVTERNKLLAGVLSLPIVAVISAGTYSCIRIAIGPVLQLPEIDLDPFKICIYERWRLGELLYVNLLIAFDLLSFSIILVRAKRSAMNRYLGVPSILDTILRDATVYFMLMFAIQLSFQLFLFFAPADIQLLPGIACTVLTPMMASRLMLSLRKAAIEPTGLWSHTTSSHFGGRREPADGILFVSPTFSRSHNTLKTTHDEWCIEL